MRTLLLCCLLAGSSFAQTGKLGVFTNSGDVGSPTLKGSTDFDAAKGQYKMTGAGANIWAKEDQFQYVWKEMSGNVSVTATMQFLGEGAPHRKAGIMLRKTLDTDSPYVDVVVTAWACRRFSGAIPRATSLTASIFLTIAPGNSN